MGLPRALWMTTALFGPLAYFLAFKRKRVFNTRTFATLLGFGGLITPLASSLYTRIYEGRFVENSSIINDLVKFV